MNDCRRYLQMLLNVCSIHPIHLKFFWLIHSLVALTEGKTVKYRKQLISVQGLMRLNVCITDGKLNAILWCNWLAVSQNCKRYYHFRELCSVQLNVDMAPVVQSKSQMHHCVSVETFSELMTNLSSVSCVQN